MKVRVSVAFFLLVGSSFAQVDPGVTVHRLRVRLAFANGNCDRSARVKLISVGGPSIESVPTERCEVEFVNIPVGTYHVSVSGMDFATVDNIISAWNGSPDYEIKVNRATDPDRVAPGAASSFVSVTDLAIPSKAQKEFDKAQRLIDRQDFQRALQALHQAIAIYPAYAGAYNNLGVVYARLGDRDKEREALQKAVSINDHFAPAYVNLGRMDITAGDFGSAESKLDKASSYDPTDAMTLVLLTYSQLMNRHFDLAIATGRRAHQLPGPHAFAHQVAARAYEQKRDAAHAIAEIDLFLKEEPSGQRADIARKELAQLQAIVQRTAVRTQ